MSITNKILVLGAGPVSAPVVEYLARNIKNEVTVACRSLAHAEAISSKFPRSTAISLDATSPDLDGQVATHDVVVSLIPPNFHPAIARSAIRHKKHFLCTSFTRPEILSMDAAAQDAGIALVTEIGVAPGLDHVFAVKTIEAIHSAGGKVDSFTSFGGGLPAPECSNNPLRIKFSWNPKNTILSQKVATTYLENGHVIEIAGKDLMDSARPISVDDNRYSFVGFGSGSSIPFREHYNITEALTIIRGTLRYKENPIMISTLSKIGWLDSGEKEWLRQDANLSWAQVTQKLLKTDGNSEESLATVIKKFPHLQSTQDADATVDGLRWIGIFSPEPVAIVAQTLIDTICSRLEELCKWNPGERDMIMLQHRFGIKWPDGKSETRTLTFELYGDPDSYTAMGKATGITCGIVTQLLLDQHDTFARPGLLRPYSPEICGPVREKLEYEGLIMRERILDQ